MRKYIKRRWSDYMTFNAFKRTVTSKVTSVGGGWYLQFGCPSPNPGDGEFANTVVLFELQDADNIFVAGMDSVVEMREAALSTLYSADIYQDGSATGANLQYHECVKHLPDLD